MEAQPTPDPLVDPTCPVCRGSGTHRDEEHIEQTCPCVSLAIYETLQEFVEAHSH